MSKADEMLQLKRYVPQILLKFLGYKIRSKNEKCTSFQKIVCKKDYFNYAIEYEIHIFLDNAFNTREICVVPHYLANNMYDWFNGKQALKYLYKLDKKFVKYTKLGVVR